jgi:AbrB family looped-hinge helix DNA binding protein
MDVEYTTLTSKGQLVIPAKLRRKLRIKAGTRIAVREERGQLILQPMTDAYIDAMCGILGDTTRMMQIIQENRRNEG